jgi:uncharacterized membrane protein
MSKKFIEKESKRWTELEIINSEQQKQILDLYEDREHAIGLIPLLGSILVGLGILTFIAANWQDISHLLRLSMIITLLTGFYVSGEVMIKKGQDMLGISLISLGLISFGAGIILIAQMFQLEAYNVTSWAIWAAVGVLLTYLYQSRYLFLLTSLLLFITQFVSIEHFQTFSYLTFIITVIGLGYYIWKKPDTLLTWLFGISFIVQSFMLVVGNELKIIWFFIPVFALYTLVDVMKKNKTYYPLQSSSLIAGFIFALFIVFFGNDDMYFEKYEDLLTESIFFFISIGLLFCVSMFYKVKSGKASSGIDWILAPVLLYLPIHEDILYLFILFIFSLFQLWRGYVEEWRFKINLGTVLFLISTMVAYGKLTWNFMDKSLFFILGGIILLLLSWFLNRRRKQFIDHEEADDHA